MQIMPASSAIPPQAGATARVQTAQRTAGGDVSAPVIGTSAVTRNAEAVQRLEARSATQESPVEQLEQALAEANQQPSVVAANLSFSIDQDSKRVVVKLIDNTTQDVIRQIPSEEFLRMSRAIQQMQGLLVKEVA